MLRGLINSAIRSQVSGRGGAATGRGMSRGTGRGMGGGTTRGMGGGYGAGRRSAGGGDIGGQVGSQVGRALFNNLMRRR